MQMLVEYMNNEQSGIIQESVNDGKNLYISGIFMQSEIRNRNGRIYPQNEMQRVVEQANATIKETNGIFGVLDHPDTLKIESDRVSHTITQLRMEGNNVYGKAKILNTPMGQIAKVLITESGVKMGVSSRGAGNVNEQGIVTDFNLVTIDIVNTPSCASAYPSSIYEGLHNSVAGYKAIQLSEQVQHDVDAQKYLVAEIKKYLSEIAKYTK